MLLKLFIISTIITLWYAWSRSMHDKQLFGTDNYKWHWWALQEAIVLNTLFISGLVFLVKHHLLAIPTFKVIALWPANAILFWIVFDMLMGWHAVRDIWYLGTTGFDKEIRKVFLYYNGNTKGKAYFSFKLLLYIIIVFGVYFEIGLDDLWNT